MVAQYSVLMSLYSQEKPEYLRASIDSMLQQTVRPDELVLVQDGPLTEQLENVLQEYQARYPQWLQVVVSEQNIGLGLALNLGLQHCRNELVARMDTDDLSLPERCAKQLQAFAQDQELAIVGTNVAEFAEQPQKIIAYRLVPSTHQQIYQFAKRRSAFNHPTVMYKKSKVLGCGGYSDLRRNQDVDLFGRMLFRGCKAANLKEPLLLFRTNRALALRRKSWLNTKSYIATIRKLWLLGYAGLVDYLLVMLGQTLMFLCPWRLQNWLYQRFLRG